MRHNRRTVALVLLLLTAACRRQTAPVAPAPVRTPENVFALLPEEDGSVTAIVVSNQAGSQEITRPNEAVRVQDASTSPGAPFTLDPASAANLFGAALDALPDPEARFVLYFDEGRDTLNAASQAEIPAILKAIADRRSTSILVTGHTDTTGTPAANVQLGLRRAESVASVLVSSGVNRNNLSLRSHGQSDLLVKTPPGRSEQRNRRVEVIVH